MSFSQEIKTEIANLKINQNTDLIKIELLGFILSNVNNISTNMNFLNENKEVITRYTYILKNICKFVVVEDDSIHSKSKKNIKYMLDIIDIEDCETKLEDVIKYSSTIDSQEKMVAFLRGAFLGSGYLSDPNKDYHLEFVMPNIEMCNTVKDYLDKIEISNNIIKRKNQNIVYVKDSENIADLLIHLGASVGLLNFEETRIIKEMNNNLNRVINCETANLTKTINTANEQLEWINQIIESGKYKLLSSNLQIVCDKRKENPEMSLLDLAQLIGISKSGLNNRFRRLKEIAKEIEGEEYGK